MDIHGEKAAEESTSKVYFLMKEQMILSTAMKKLSSQETSTDTNYAHKLVSQLCKLVMESKHLCFHPKSRRPRSRP